MLLRTHKSNFPWNQLEKWIYLLVIIRFSELESEKQKSIWISFSEQFLLSNPLHHFHRWVCTYLLDWILWFVTCNAVEAISPTKQYDNFSILHRRIEVHLILCHIEVNCAVQMNGIFLTSWSISPRKAVEHMLVEVITWFSYFQNGFFMCWMLCIWYLYFHGLARLLIQFEHTLINIWVCTLHNIHNTHFCDDFR